MKTSDLFKINRSSQRLNEGLEKFFGKKLNLESFDLPRLEDARNKLRTQISQVRSESGFNENLENDAYAQAQWMLDAINAEIAEREEFIADAGTAEASYEEGYGTLEDEVIKLVNNFDRQANEVRAYGDPDIDKVIEYLKQGDVQSAVDEVFSSYADQDGGEVHALYDYADDLEAEFEGLVQGDFDQDPSEAEGGDSEAMASAGYGSDEDYGTFPESTQGEAMKKVTEGEIQQASAIVTAKTMVDRVGRWIEELSGMENDTLLQLGDQIRDEMGSEQAKQFISTVAPAIQTALDSLKDTRETLSTGVRTLTGEEQPAEMLGAEAPEGGEEELGAAEPDAMNMPAEEPEAPLGDEFAAAEPASGGSEAAGREKRESIQFENRLLKVLAG
jgi:hypothetical protein